MIGKERIGHVTSGAYGHNLGAAVGLAWVHGDLAADVPVTVEVRGGKVRAMLSREPFYDPTGDKLRDRVSKARA